MRLGLLALIGLASAASVAAVQTARASDSQAGTSVKANIDPFAQALAARFVAEFARREKDVGAMIVAARMLADIPTTQDSAESGAFTPKGLLEEAKTFANGNRMLLMQIQVAQSTASRGVATSAFGKGLVRRVQTVLPLAGYQFNVQAVAGEPLRIGAIGDTNTVLAMRMRDAAGKTVCVDDNGDYGPVCQLMSVKAGSYRIEIINKSTVSSRAVILSN